MQFARLQVQSTATATATWTGTESGAYPAITRVVESSVAYEEEKKASAAVLPRKLNQPVIKGISGMSAGAMAPAQKYTEPADGYTLMVNTMLA